MVAAWLRAGGRVRGAALPAVAKARADGKSRGQGKPMQSTGAGTTGSMDTSQWEELLCQGAQEVFEMMVNVPLRRCQSEEERKAGGFTAVIGVAGPITGVFALRCSEGGALAMACGMLGLDKEAARTEMWDALGEVCNMVIGNFKGKTGTQGANSVLSVPTVIYGQDYKVRPLVNGQAVECRMECEGGLLHMRLDYKLA